MIKVGEKKIKQRMREEKYRGATARWEDPISCKGKPHKVKNSSQKPKRQNEGKQPIQPLDNTESQKSIYCADNPHSASNSHARSIKKDRET